MDKICQNCNANFTTRDTLKQACSMKCRDELRWKRYIESIPKEAIDMWLDNKSGSEIAKKFNVHPSTVCKWMRDAANIDTRKQRFIGEKSRNWRGYRGISQYFWKRINYQAKYREIPIDITIEDAWNQYEAQGGRCALSGVILDLECNKNTKGFAQEGEMCASLDRKDSNLGYTKNNIQWVHKKINLMKRDLSDKDFIHWCNCVANEHSRCI